MRCYAVIEESGEYEDRHKRTVKYFSSCYKEERFKQELEETDSYERFMYSMCGNCRGMNSNCIYRTNSSIEGECEVYGDHAFYEKKQYTIKEIEVEE